MRKIEKLLGFAFFGSSFISGGSGIGCSVCGSIGRSSGVIGSRSGVSGCIGSGISRRFRRYSFFNGRSGFVSGNSGFVCSFFSGDSGIGGCIFRCLNGFVSNLLDVVRSGVCVFLDRAHEAFTGCRLDTG